MRRGLAVPNFAENPADLIELGAEAERAGFDGFFLWDHIVFTDTGDGPPIADPWQVLAAVAARTSRIRLRRMFHSQAAGFAATLPCGICPLDLSRRWPR